jgi:hypothetical protein
MSIQQLFCSVADLVADMEKPGSDESRLLQAIREASDELQKEIGWFIPVTQTTLLRGTGKQYLYPFPPVLSLTGSVVNADIPLVLDTDFSLLRQAWANGPYIGLELKYGASARSWCDLDPDSVEIPCRAGFYERLNPVDATVQDSTEQSSTQSTLKVSNGGKVSPGMTLRIDDEQQLVTGWGSPTESVTALNGAISATDDVITVDDGGLLNIGEVLRAGFEQVRIKDKRGHECFVDRGWNNTGQTAHSDNLTIDVYRTVTVERAVNGTSAATHSIDTEIYRYMVPDDILFLTKQIATLIINKARGGYAGKSGSGETGQVFYHDVFPRFEIERVKENYQLGKS